MKYEFKNPVNGLAESSAESDVVEQANFQPNNIEQNNPEQNMSVSNINLYRHGIKITLSGRYFELRDYLLQLEQLSWKFFWQEFDLK